MCVSATVHTQIVASIAVIIHREVIFEDVSKNHYVVFMLQFVTGKKTDFSVVYFSCEVFFFFKSSS